jgi:type IV secretion system protein VirD4
MQLPPADELVLISGVPPIRAKKARYFEDPRLTERVLAPPAVSKQSGAVPSDDWSQLLVYAATHAGRDVNASGETRIDDPANAGIRREPELPEHEEIAPERANPTPEFAFGEEDRDDDAMRARVPRQQARGLARQAAMDPGDGIDL